jgi:hypothetical protein
MWIDTGKSIAVGSIDEAPIDPGEATESQAIESETTESGAIERRVGSAVLTEQNEASEHAAATGSEPLSAERAPRPGRRRIDPVATCVIIATAIFALAGIGTPLLGLSVFADPGLLAQYSGYSGVLAGVEVQTENQRDVVDVMLPTAQLFRDSLLTGDYASWNPYSLTGEPFGSMPNAGLATPLSSPYWLLPTWLAPAYVKLLELICAIGGTVLFLRRLRLSHAATWLGGLVFASSGFMVVWTNWPQTRVAALIPALFWALECLAQRLRPRNVTLVALPVAAMLLGGFPAVTGYALVTAGIYFLVRVIGEHGRAIKANARTFAAAGAGVMAGVGLAAWQLIPWIQYMPTVLLAGRAQDETEHLPVEALLTTVAPYALGTANPADRPTWFGGLEIIAAHSYVGAAALMLAITAIALAGSARTVLPRGTWWAIVGMSSIWATAIYLGGPVLGGLQQCGFLFSDNFIGRARSVLGFLVAVLASVGFEVVLRMRRESRHAIEPLARRTRFGYSAGVWVCSAGAAVVVYIAARRLAGAENAGRGEGDPSLVPYVNHEALAGLALMLLAGVTIAWLWFARRRATGPHRALRLTATAVIPLLVAGQALAFVSSYWPRTERENFYPSTPTQEFLAANLGHSRYYGADGAIYGSVDVAARIRSLHGHGFVDRSLAELVETLPGEQFTVPPTAIVSDSYGGVAATRPVLDRAAVSHYVVPPEVRPFGSLTEDPATGPPIPVRPGQTVTWSVPVTGPVRGIGVVASSLGDAAPSGASLTVVLRDAAGVVVSAGTRTGDELTVGTPWIVPLTGESLPRESIASAEITVRGVPGLELDAHDSRPALAVVSPVEDGLKLVYANETVIYERATALPRARWAAASRVVTDRQERINLLGYNRLQGDEVVLSAPGPAAQGKPGEVTWVTDGMDEMVLSVRAEGAGYLVLADAIRNGWKVAVDGQPATLVAADHAFAAVAVPVGTHTVRLWYPSPFVGPGMWITLGAALGLGLAAGAPAWRRRRPTAPLP